MSTSDTDKEPPSEAREEFNTHRQLVFWLFAATAGVVAVMAILLLDVEEGQSTFSILKLVVLSGALGAFVSALRRLYAFENVFPTARFRDLLRGARLYVIIYSLIPPLVGAIAAAVLYVLFAAQVVVSPLFPTFMCDLGESKCLLFNEFINNWKPTGATDYAKAAVWGFIAGFSERVVPDILNKLAENNEFKKHR
jgi:hypothetical protein